MKKLEYLIIHCTATPEGRKVSSDDIRLWHLSPKVQGGRGWRQVGYSDIVHLDGVIENMVEYNSDNWVQSNEITNGAGAYNSISRHIVYVGGCSETMKPKNTLTDSQFVSLHNYIKDTVKQHPDIKVIGHNQVAARACPSFNVYEIFGCVIPQKNRI